jgi:hypothetical protein
MQKFLLFTFALCVFFSGTANAQTKPKKPNTPYPTVGLNLDKIELIEVSINYSSGGRARSRRDLGMQINNGAYEALSVKKLRYYYSACPKALGQLNEYDVSKKKARKSYIGFLIGPGSGIALGGLTYLVTKKEEAALGVFAAASFGVSYAYILKGYKHSRRAEKAIYGSLEAYEQCNTTALAKEKTKMKTDSMPSAKTDANKSTTQKPANSAASKNGKKQDELNENEVRILKSDPQNLRGFLFNLGGFAEMGDAYNQNFGVEASFTYKLPKTDVQARALYGLLHSTDDGKNNAYESYFPSVFYGHAAEPAKMLQLEGVVTQQIFGRINEARDGVYLGKVKLGTGRLKNKANEYGNYTTKRLQSLHLRAGIQIFQRPFQTEGLRIDTFPFTFLGYETDAGKSFGVAKATHAIGGLSFRRTFNDGLQLKHNGVLRDLVHIRAFEIYADALIPMRFETQSVTLGFDNPSSAAIPHTTYVTSPYESAKVGFRLGFRTMSPGKLNVHAEIGQTAAAGSVKAQYGKIGGYLNLARLK